MESISLELDHYSPFFYKDIVRYLIELCIDSDIEKYIIYLGSTCRLFHTLYKEARSIIVSRLRNRDISHLSDGNLMNSICTSIEIDALPYNFNVGKYLHSNIYIRRYIVSILNIRLKTYTKSYGTRLRKLNISGRRIISMKPIAIINDHHDVNQLQSLIKQISTNTSNVRCMNDDIYSLVNHFGMFSNINNLDKNITKAIEVLSDSMNNTVVNPINNIMYKNSQHGIGIRRIGITRMVTDTNIVHIQAFPNIEDSKYIFRNYVHDITDVFKLREVLHLVEAYISNDINDILRHHIQSNHIDIIKVLLTIYKGDVRNIVSTISSMKMLYVLQKFLENTKGNVSYDYPYTNILSNVTSVNTYLLIPYTSIYFNEVLRDE